MHFCWYFDKFQILRPAVLNILTRIFNIRCKNVFEFRIYFILDVIVLYSALCTKFQSLFNVKGFGICVKCINTFLIEITQILSI